MKQLIILLIISLFSLSQTIEVVELPLPNTNKVVVKLMFKNGSITDPAGKEGLTFLTANLITQGGTDKMSYSEIQEFIYPMAVNYFVSVDKEVTTFTFEVHKDFLEKFYPVMTALILEPSYTTADFERVKINQQNYVDQVIRASSDEEYSKKALEDLLFRGTNYQHMKQGKSSSVKSLTLEDVKAHYEQYFTRNNLMLGIAGNYSNEYLNQLKSDIGKLPNSKPVIPEPGKARKSAGIEVEIIAKENAFGSAIFTGFPLEINRSNDNFAALMVANSYLGEHRKAYSKLYQEIRQKRSMNYGDYSYIEWYESGGRNMLPPPGVPRHSNYFAIWIRPVQIAKQLTQQYEELSDIQVGHAHFALRMAFYELDKLVKTGLTQNDFESTRTFLRSYIKLYVQTPTDRLGFLMDSKFYGRDNYIDELDQLLANLTLEDVNKAIKKQWQIDNMYVTIVTDASEAEPLAKNLRENLTSPMSYSNIVKAGLSDDILKDDEIVAKFPLNVKEVKIVKSADTFK